MLFTCDAPLSGLKIRYFCPRNQSVRTPRFHVPVGWHTFANKPPVASITSIAFGKGCKVRYPIPLSRILAVISQDRPDGQDSVNKYANSCFIFEIRCQVNTALYVHRTYLHNASHYEEVIHKWTAGCASITTAGIPVDPNK